MYGKLLLGVTFIFFSISLSAFADTRPLPQEPGNETGYFCKMTVINHSGAKAQIFIKNKDNPLWFPTIRDLFIYINSPEEDQRILAMYVNDMGRANWDQPEAGTWVDAKSAYYVIGSSRINGMGGKAIIPFADKSKALEFMTDYGGTLKSFENIPQSYIFSAQEINHMEHMQHMDHTDDGNDSQATENMDHTKHHH